MSDFDMMIGAIKYRLKSIITDHHFCTRKKCHDCTFAYSCISNDNDGFVAVGIFGDARDSVLDHFSEFEEVEGILHV